VIRLQTLGALRASGPEGEVRVGRKELALLAYLARRSPQPAPREELAALLWGERRDAQARQSLRQALVRLKRAVNLPLDVQAESVAFLPGAWELDVAAFEADLAAGRLREAVARWEGDFLAGTEDVGGEGYRQWVEVEREALRQRVGRALEHLVAQAERAADWRAAVEWAERWTAARPLEERVHRRLIEVLHLAGRPEDALARHEAFVTRLRAELGIEPSAEILRLGAELAQQRPSARRARPSPGSRALFTPDLVGRATAFGELSACWAAVRAGTGTAVLVDGDEGIGKTRLCEEFLRSVTLAGDDAPVVLRARGYEAGRDVAWAVARELLAPLKDAPGLPGASPGALVGLGRLVPAIRERFPPPPAAAPGEWSPEEAVAEVLAAAAAESPVIVFVDDLPSADSATQQLILSLTRRGLGLRVFLLLAARTEDLERSAALAELRTGKGAHRLRLQPLRELDVEALLGSMLDLPPEDRRRLSERLLAESGGNPFQIIQVTAALLDEGYLTPDAGGTWQLAPMPPNQPIPLPGSVREAVARRLAGLGEAARRVAEAAAVLAEPAAREVLRQVSGLSASDLDGALDELVGHRLLRAAPHRSDSYEFTHDVSRRVVYDSLPPLRRQALHHAALWSHGTPATPDDARRAARRYHRARAGAAPTRLVHWLQSRPAGRATAMLGVVAAMVVGGYATLGPRPHRSLPVVAVGTIRDYTRSDTSSTASELADILSTNLARVPGLQVISTARLYEILGQLGALGNTGTAIARAARQAGATELLEGALHRAPDGALRLDLRRVDLVRGALRGAYTAQGQDPFALVDSTTSQLARGLDIQAPALRVADVTTSSLVAHRFYQEGLRVYYQGDARSAQHLFDAALAEDSTFAMAAYYAAMAQLALGNEPGARATLFRAAPLADRAGERERLLIRTTLAFLANEPEGLVMAESLAGRYPTDPDGHLLVGQALVGGGQFLAALPHLRRVVDMDSLAFRGGAVRCRACDALGAINGAYLWTDSLAAAERIAREAIRLTDNSPGWRQELAWNFELQGRAEEALATFLQIDPQTPGLRDPGISRARVAIRTGDFGQADRILNDLLRGAAGLRSEALWFLSISLRYQGRLTAALSVARRLRRLTTESSASNIPGESVIEAQAFFEMGRFRQAAALYDSLRQQVSDPDFPALAARHRTWQLTHVATALAAAGDTAMVAALADRMETSGQQSAYGRDRRLHHHARGLLWRARGRPAEAEAAFRHALYSPTAGYTRTSLELGRTLLELGRPREAIAVVGPALRGPLEASNLYVTHTELHELLARAHDAGGQPDSASAHYRWVVNAWRNADPMFRGRLEAARQRLAALQATVSR
jgi:DNA-binding SARP family transcriptional activator/tetratricopeptide (TPR) repeat protein